MTTYTQMVLGSVVGSSVELLQLGGRVNYVSQEKSRIISVRRHR